MIIKIDIIYCVPFNMVKIPLTQYEVLLILPAIPDKIAHQKIP